VCVEKETNEERVAERNWRLIYITARERRPVMIPVLAASAVCFDARSRLPADRGLIPICLRHQSVEPRKVCRS
jgi:hypothetical protein